MNTAAELQDALEQWNGQGDPPPLSTVTTSKGYRTLSPAGRVQAINQAQRNWADRLYAEDPVKYGETLREVEQDFNAARRTEVEQALAEDLRTGALSDSAVKKYVTGGLPALVDEGEAGSYVAQRYGRDEDVSGPWVTQKMPLAGADGKQAGYSYVRHAPGKDTVEVSYALNASDGRIFGTEDVPMDEALARPRYVQQTYDQYFSGGPDTSGVGGGVELPRGFEQEKQEFDTLPDPAKPFVYGARAAMARLQQKPEIVQRMGQGGLTAAGGEAMKGFLTLGAAATYGPAALFGSTQAAQQYAGAQRDINSDFEGMSRAGFAGGMWNDVATGLAREAIPTALSMGTSAAASALRNGVSSAVGRNFLARMAAMELDNMGTEAAKVSAEKAAKIVASELMGGSAGLSAKQALHASLARGVLGKAIGTAPLESRGVQMLADRVTNALAFLPNSARSGLDNMLTTLNAAEEARAAGDEQKAQELEGNAVMNGWAGVLTETLSENMWLNEMLVTRAGRPLSRVATDVLSRRMKPGAMSALTQRARQALEAAVKSGAQEGTEEVAAGVGGRAWMNEFAAQNKDLLEGMPQEFVTGAVMGSIMGGAKGMAENGKPQVLAELTRRGLDGDPAAQQSLANIRALAENKDLPGKKPQPQGPGTPSGSSAAQGAPVEAPGMGAAQTEEAASAPAPVVPTSDVTRLPALLDPAAGTSREGGLLEALVVEENDFAGVPEASGPADLLQPEGEGLLVSPPPAPAPSSPSGELEQAFRDAMSRGAVPPVQEAPAMLEPTPEMLGFAARGALRDAGAAVSPDSGGAPAPAEAQIEVGRVEAPPVPDTLETVTEQARLAADRNSTRRAVLITPGTPRPDKTPGLKGVKTRHGLLLYNPKKVPLKEAMSAARAEVFDARILGMSEAANGTTQGTGAVGVTASTPAAQNVQAELVTDPAALPAAVAAAQAAAPGAVVEVKPASQVLTERAAGATSGALPDAAAIPQRAKEKAGQPPALAAGRPAAKAPAVKPNRFKPDVKQYPVASQLAIAPQNPARQLARWRKQQKGGLEGALTTGDRKLSKERGEYNNLPTIGEFQGRPIAQDALRRIYRNGNTLPPDKAFQQVGIDDLEQGIAQLRAELRSMDTIAREQKAQETQERQGEAFYMAISDGPIQVQASQLRKGDVLNVEGEEARVIQVKYDEGEWTPSRIVLEDGRKFGRQTIDGDMALFVEGYEPAGGQAFGLAAQTDEGIAQERQAAAERDRATAARNAMQDRAAAPLTGRDTTGQGALFASDADLFSGPAAEDMPFSKPSEPVPGAPSVKHGESAVRILGSKAPEIVKDLRVVANVGELNPADYTPKQWAGIREGGTEGFFHPASGQSVVILDNIQPRAGESPVRAVARVILHERLGHAGLGVLRRSDAKFAQQWADLVARIPAEELMAIASESGYAGIASDEQSLAEEWLARHAERVKLEPPGSPLRQLWDALVAAVRRLMSAFSPGGMTAEQLAASLLQRSRKALSRSANAAATQNGGTDTAVRMSTAAGAAQADSTPQDAEYLAKAKAWAATLPDALSMEQTQKEFDSSRNETPYEGQFNEGEWSADRYGEDPYIYEARFIRPEDFKDVLKLEGMTYEQVVQMPSTQRYIQWYKEGRQPPPVDVVTRYDGRKVANNRRRLVAALEAGVQEIPARVEIGRATELMPVQDDLRFSRADSRPRLPQEEGVRRFGGRLPENENLREEWRAAFVPGTYEKFTFDELSARASALIGTHGLEGALALWRSDGPAMAAHERNALAQALSYGLDRRALEAYAAGDTAGGDAATAALDEVVDAVERESTTHAQALASMRLWYNLSPQAVVGKSRRQWAEAREEEAAGDLSADGSVTAESLRREVKEAAAKDKKDDADDLEAAAQRTAKRWIERLATSQSDTLSWRKRSTLSELERLIRAHLKEANPEFRSEAEALGLPVEQSRVLDALIREEHRRREGIAREKALEALVKRLTATAKPDTREKMPPFIRDLYRAAAAGVLTREAFLDAYAAKYGRTRWTREFAAEIGSLATAVQAQPAGSWMRQRAMNALHARMGRWEGIPWRKVLTSMWYGNILSGMGTQLVNVSGNAFHLMQRSFQVLVTQPRHFVAFLQGMAAGARQGLREGGAAFRKGEPVMRDAGQWAKEDVLELLWMSPNSELNFAQKLARYGAASWGRYVFRTLTAADAFFYNTAAEGKAWALMSRAGGDVRKAAGMDAASWQRHLAGARADMAAAGVKDAPARDIRRRAYERALQARDAETQAQAQRWGAHTTFNYDPEGTFGLFHDAAQAAHRYLSGKEGAVAAVAAGVVRMFIPFSRLVSNMADVSADWTPIGIARGLSGGHLVRGKGQKFSSIERAERLAAGIIGTGLMGAIYALASGNKDDDDRVQFMLYGQGPADPARRAAMPRGWKPSSIKIGNTYYSYEGTPLVFAFSIIGTALDQERYGKQRGEDGWTRAGALLAAAPKSMLNAGVLSSISQTFDMLEGKKKPGGFLGRQAAAWIPGSAFLRDVAIALDPQKVDTATFMSTLQSYIPVLRGNAAPQLNAFGEPVQEPGPWIISRIARQQDRTDADAVWLMQNKLHIPMPDSEIAVGQWLQPSDKTRLPSETLARIADGYLTPEERNTFLRTTGPLIRRAVQFHRHRSEAGQKVKQSDLNRSVEVIRRQGMRELIR